MHDEQAVRVQRATEQFLFADPEFNFAHPEHFPRLVEHVRQALLPGEDAAPAEVELHCAVALSALGPFGGPPPRSVREQLLEIVDELPGGDPARVLELAVAYGCGRWRSVSPRSNTWEGKWDKAFFTLVRVVESAVKTCNKWLAHPRVVDYPKASTWLSEEGRALIASDAHLLALFLVDPVRPLHITQDQELRIRCTGDGSQIEVDHGRYSHFSPAGSKWVFETTEPT
jgi:hypothetical protein